MCVLLLLFFVFGGGGGATGHISHFHLLCALTCFGCLQNVDQNTKHYMYFPTN